MLSCGRSCQILRNLFWAGRSGARNEALEHFGNEIGGYQVRLIMMAFNGQSLWSILIVSPIIILSVYCGARKQIFLLLCDSGELLFPRCKFGSQYGDICSCITPSDVLLNPQNASIVLTFSQLAAV